MKDPQKGDTNVLWKILEFISVAFKPLEVVFVLGLGGILAKLFLY